MSGCSVSARPVIRDVDGLRQVTAPLLTRSFNSHLPPTIIAHPRPACSPGVAQSASARTLASSTALIETAEDVPRRHSARPWTKPRHSKLPSWAPPQNLKDYSESPSLLETTYRTLSYNASVSPSDAVDLFRRISRTLARHHNLAALSPLVDWLLRQIVEAEGLVNPAELVRRYRDCVLALWFFGSHGRATHAQDGSLPRPLPMLVLKMLRHLFAKLDSLPSGSDQGETLQQLLPIMERYLTPEIRDLLVDRLMAASVQIPRKVAYSCYVSACRQGDQELATVFREMRWVSPSPERSPQIMKPPHLDISIASLDLPFPTAMQARIEQMMLGRMRTSLRDFVSTLRSTSELHGTDAQAMACSILLSMIGKDPSVPLSVLVEVQNQLPDTLSRPEVITPLMKAFILRGDRARAWELWSAMKDPDRIALAVATEICADLHGLDAATQLLDDASERMFLDAQNINVLLKAWRATPAT